MRQCFGRRALRGGRGDRRRSSQAGAARAGGRMSCAEWRKSVVLRRCHRHHRLLLHLLLLLPSSLFPLPSSLSEGMRRQFVPGHFFRFADNKPSRFASLLPSLLSIERRPPPPTQTRREWRYDNTGDVKIAPLFIASFLFIRQLWCCTT